PVQFTKFQKFGLQQCSYDKGDTDLAYNTENNHDHVVFEGDPEVRILNQPDILLKSDKGVSSVVVEAVDERNTQRQQHCKSVNRINGYQIAEHLPDLHLEY